MFSNRRSDPPAYSFPGLDPPFPIPYTLNMNIEPLLPPDRFAGLDGVTHLCTGGEAPWLKSQSEVSERFARLKSAGFAGRAEIYAAGEECRARMGRLWEVEPARIAFLPAAADGMSWIARGLDWREGDNIVTTNLEFPSVAYAWRNLRPRGVEVRMVPHRNWTVREEDLLDATDSRTRVLAASQVSFYTGQNLDIPRLRKGTKERGILLAVDATHASGVLGVSAGDSDITVSSSYKWMIATHGTAPCYVSPRAEAQISETCFGWHNLEIWPPQGAERHADAEEKPMPERMEAGNPAMLIIMHLGKSLETLLEIGIDSLENHAKDLSERTSAGLEKLGLMVISPRDRAARSGNTCFLSDDARELQNRLAGKGILVWGEFGRVRISTHLHNGSDDVERLLAALRE